MRGVSDSADSLVEEKLPSKNISTHYYNFTMARIGSIVNLTEVALFRRGLESLLDHCADCRSLPEGLYGLDRWSKEKNILMSEIKDHAATTRKAVRNVKFFADCMKEQDFVRHTPPSVLQQVQYELNKLDLTHLLRIRLLQNDFKEWPEAQETAHRFVEDLESGILLQYFDYVMRNTTGDNALHTYLYTTLRGCAAITARKNLSRELILLLGAARSFLMPDLYDTTLEGDIDTIREKREVITNNPSWWRAVFPVKSEAVPPTATPRADPRVPVHGLTELPISRDEVGVARMRQRSCEKMAAARCRSVAAMKSQIRASGSRILDIFLKLPTHEFTTQRPQAIIYLAHNTDLVQPYGTTGGTHKKSFDIIEAAPDDSLEQFFRPQDFNCAMRWELKSQLHARAASISSADNRGNKASIMPNKLVPSERPKTPMGDTQRIKTPIDSANRPKTPTQSTSCSRITGCRSTEQHFATPHTTSVRSSVPPSADYRNNTPLDYRSTPEGFDGTVPGNVTRGFFDSFGNMMSLLSPYASRRAHPRYPVGANGVSSTPVAQNYNTATTRMVGRHTTNTRRGASPPIRLTASPASERISRLERASRRGRSSSLSPSRPPINPKKRLCVCRQPTISERPTSSSGSRKSINGIVETRPYSAYRPFPQVPEQSRVSRVGSIKSTRQQHATTVHTVFTRQKI